MENRSFGGVVVVVCRCTGTGVGFAQRKVPVYIQAKHSTEARPAGGNFLTTSVCLRLLLFPT